MSHAFGLEAILEKASLGPNTSEDTARIARYNFFNWICSSGNRKLITAHHQDDAIETAIINLVRGTSNDGLCSIYNQEIARPLLAIDKVRIIDYALSNNLHWLDDTTNEDVRLLRNRIRLMYMPKMSEVQRARFLTIIGKAKAIRDERNLLMSVIDEYVSNNSNILMKSSFVGLDQDIAQEYLKHKLKNMVGVSQLMLARVVMNVKNLTNGKKIVLSKNCSIEIGRTDIRIVQQ
jgi:tRNA(Ile)-lysidine synthase